MSKVLILYYSKTGNTEEMVQYIEEGVKKEGVDVDIKKVQDVTPDVLLEYDGIIIGSPTYYGSMAAEIKQLFDESVRFHGDLTGKVGGAFTSAANLAGGNETTILGILKAMLIHGMIIQGDAMGDHYGPVAIGKPDERAKKECMKLGGNIARLVKRLK
ncbi:MAG TPA: NAD(P)H-dependent oxidoreductase [Nitrospinota bacterium]|nr:NAD(P)H-dependent oxidoreductase [Nitrospinota bacterium]